MYQITAIYQDSEIGYGEGESLKYALEDCGASISPMYENEQVELLILENDVRIHLSGRVYLSMNGETAITAE
jgi:hypothetical protein